MDQLLRNCMNADATKFDTASQRKVIREAEEVRTRLAYQRHPDAESEADDWVNADNWEPCGAA